MSNVRFIDKDLSNIDFIKKRIELKELRLVGVREAFRELQFEKFSESDMEFFKDFYFTTKGEDRVFHKNMILHAFIFQCSQYDLKDFFLTAFKKLRHLDIRLTAIRGYAHYATEAEVILLMDKFLASLIKLPEHTPYAYQEYESIRSQFGLGYLVERYGYDCFKKALEQTNQQYEAMPENFRSIIRMDENGFTTRL